MPNVLLKQLLPASADFPSDQIVTVARFDRLPTVDDLVVHHIRPVTAERIIRTGRDGLKRTMLWIEQEDSDDRT